MSKAQTIKLVPDYWKVRPREHIDRLDQRRLWLTERIKAKEIVGWETVYDRSERDALAWALPHLRRLLEDRP